MSMHAVAIRIAKTASDCISLLIVELMVSAVIFSASTEKFSTIASLNCSLSSTVSVLVLKITSLVPATFCVCTFPSPVIASINGTILLSISSIVLSSLKVTFVEVPPTNSRL